MKKYLKKTFYAGLRSSFSNPFKRLTLRLSHHIEAENKESLERLVKEVCKERTVLSGPFKGLRYPEMFSYGSALYPKLIGSYEMELHETIERLLKNKYTEIFDIGSAEGYYAVGLALIAKEAKVYAYEIEDTSRNFSQKMAVENGVSERIVLGKDCTAETLRKFPFKNGLILCDCEGYEEKLFTPASILNLKKCDLIIELHDFIIPGIKDRLSQLFKASHTITIIKTQRRNRKHFKEILTKLNTKVKDQALDEYRPGVMEWMILEKK